MPPKGMTANPRPAPRYRPGKEIPEQDSSDSEDSDEEVPSEPAKPPPKATSAGGITSNLSKVDLIERRKAAAAKEAARVEEEKALKAQEEEGFVTESEEESEDEDGSEEESSEEEESEEEAPRRVLMRPVFIKKDKRGAASVPKDTRTEEEFAAEEEARRLEHANEIVEEQIRKDIAAKAAGKKYWDDEEDEDDVDDTDDLDPEAEHAAWKLREWKRIKRDKLEIEEKEKEFEERERRKNLTEEERKAEDDEHIAKQKEEKEGKGKMAYMQKYYHKGAFFQDDAKEMGLDRRDIMGSKFADDVQNRELLPQALQMRDMTKLGKKGATKYKDLKSEDTGRWGQFDDRGPRKTGFGFGDDDRFKADTNRGGASGANNMPVGERKKVSAAPEGAPQAPRGMREEGNPSREKVDSYQGNKRNDRTRSRSRSPRGGDTYRPSGRDQRSRSRSRSPRRDRFQDDHYRKRSFSRDRDRYGSDKRRRVDSR